MASTVAIGSADTPSAVSRDLVRTRECPPVQKCTRLVPAKNRDRATAGNTISPLAGIFLKLSDDSNRRSPPYHGSSEARVSFLMCPFCVRVPLLSLTTPPGTRPPRRAGAGGSFRRRPAGSARDELLSRQRTERDVRGMASSNPHVLLRHRESEALHGDPMPARTDDSLQP